LSLFNFTILIAPFFSFPNQRISSVFLDRPQTIRLQYKITLNFIHSQKNYSLSQWYFLINLTYLNYFLTKQYQVKIHILLQVLFY